MRKDKFCLFWKHLYIFRETSDLRYSDFDCGYWTGWILSNFPATLILGEINFGWFQKVKNCPFNNFEGFELWFYEKRYAWKCRKFPNIQNSELLKWSKWQFLGLLNNQNWFHVKSKWQNNLFLPRCMHVAAMCLSVKM